MNNHIMTTEKKINIKFKIGDTVIYAGVQGVITNLHEHFKGNKWEVTFSSKEKLYFHLDGKFHKFEIKPVLRLKK